MKYSTSPFRHWAFPETVFIFNSAKDKNGGYKPLLALACCLFNEYICDLS